MESQEIDFAKRQSSEDEKEKTKAKKCVYGKKRKTPPAIRDHKM